MSLRLRQQGAPIDVAAPRYVGDTGKIHRSTYIDYGEVLSAPASEIIEVGRGISLNTTSGFVSSGFDGATPTAILSGISASELFLKGTAYEKNATVAVMQRGYVGVAMIFPPTEGDADIFMYKDTGIFTGMEEEGTILIENVQIIPTWSSSNLSVLYIKRGIIHKTRGI